MTIWSRSPSSPHAAYKSKGEGDTWLAAGIDKRTGRTIYQINGFIRYVGGWRFYSVGTYSHPGGLTSGRLMTQRRIDNCYVSCQYEENVSLVVDEFTMQQVAQEGEMWRLRFQGNGVVWDDVMNPAEVAALLEAARHTRGRGFTDPRGWFPAKP
ncbi:MULTISPECIES: hypothetical protein [unclassified Sphingobium]|uniref:hypothetical protein n=1 Tax=unclassified Sphingobium TaxID=2611147 RepID=UPI0012906914|nr:MULTISPECIES: hypothetical protein [unclassified Sphingobium]